MFMCCTDLNEKVFSLQIHQSGEFTQNQEEGISLEINIGLTEFTLTFSPWTYWVKC